MRVLSPTFVGSAVPRVYLAQFGAKGDGTTDDTAAIQAAVDYLPVQGGTVVFDAGKVYRQAGNCFLRDNITVDMNSSVITKVAGDLYHAFIGQSYHGTGYMGGCQNVTIKNGTLEGSFTLGQERGIGLTFHHAQDLKFENMKWLEGMMGGHYSEFLGCNRVTFTNCTFEGFMPDTPQFRNEAIQCDYSYLVGGDLDQANLSRYDGLGCSNFTVQNCKFIPLSYAVPGGTARTVYAPNPIGTHVRMQDTYAMDGLNFTGNLVQGIRQTSDHSTMTTRGWLHFFHAKNVTISVNTFNNVPGRASQAIQTDAATGNTGYLKTDAQKTVAQGATGTATITPMPATDWSIVGNTFNDFNAASVEGIISMQGFDTALANPMLNIDIRGNQFRNSHPTNANSDTAPYLITVNRSVGTLISDNTADRCGRLVSANNNRGMLIRGNTVRESYSETIQCTAAVHLRIIENWFGLCSCGIRVSGGQAVRVAGNNMTYGSATGAIRTFVMQLAAGGAGNDLTDFIVESNIVYGTGAAQGIAVGTAGGNVTRGRIHGNISLGATTPVAITGTPAPTLVFAPLTGTATTANTLMHNVIA